jgi:hypothetical protein
LGRRKVKGVSRGRLLELLRYKDFLLVLLDDLLVVLLQERAHVCRRTCRKDLTKKRYYANSTPTVLVVSIFASRPLYYTVFSSRKSPMPPRSAARRRPAIRGYTSSLGLAETKPLSRPPIWTLSPALSGGAEQRGAPEQAATVRSRPRRQCGCSDALKWLRA